jgi:hypothetical protein
MLISLSDRSERKASRRSLFLVVLGLNLLLPCRRGCSFREGDQQARPINGAAGGWFHSARPQKKPRQSAAGRSDDVHRGWACRSSPRAFLLEAATLQERTATGKPIA